MAQLPPAEIAYQMAHIKDNRQPEMIAAYAVCGAFAIIAVFLRFLARIINKTSVEADDYTVLLGLLCAIGSLAVQSVSIAHGLGKHQILSTGIIVSARYVLASIILYIASMAATKISILLLYRRIFPNKKWHYAFWAVGLFIFAYSVAFGFVVLFPCRPVSGAWNPFIKAKCYDTNVLILVPAILTVITDLIVLVLPIPLVWKLRLPMWRKVQTTSIFFLGGL